MPGSAGPSADPIWIPVSSTPEAEPASRSGTTVSPVSMSGVSPSPSPNPMTANDAMTALWPHRPAGAMTRHTRRTRINSTVP